MATGRFYRSAHLGNASSDDRGQLAELGITTVVDLRTNLERSHYPSRVWGSSIRSLECREGEPFEAPHLEATRGVPRDRSVYDTYMKEFYRTFPLRPAYVAVFQAYFLALQAMEGPVLVHCTAGKDRTGSLVALTQRLAGLHPDDIMSDYLATNALLEDAAYMRSQTHVMERFAGGPVDREFVEMVASVHPSYLDSFWNSLGAGFGSVEGYLEQVLGLGAQAQEKIRDSLTACA